MWAMILLALTLKLPEGGCVLMRPDGQPARQGDVLVKVKPDGTAACTGPLRLPPLPPACTGPLSCEWVICGDDGRGRAKVIDVWPCAEAR